MSNPLPETARIEEQYHLRHQPPRTDAQRKRLRDKRNHIMINQWWNMTAEERDRIKRHLDL